MGCCGRWRWLCVGLFGWRGRRSPGGGLGRGSRGRGRGVGGRRCRPRRVGGCPRSAGVGWRGRRRGRAALGRGRGGGGGGGLRPRAGPGRLRHARGRGGGGGWGGGGGVAVVQPLHQGVEAAAEAVFVHAQVAVGDGVVEFGEVVGGQGAAAAQDEGEPACGQGAGVEQGQQLGQVGGGCAGVC